jgi:hypothetical protein
MSDNQIRLDLGELPMGRPVRISCGCGQCFEPFEVTGLKSQILFMPITSLFVDIEQGSVSSEVPGCLSLKAEIQEK